MRKYILASISIFIFICTPALAKKNQDLLKANYLYSNLAYHEAIPYFEKVAETNSDPVVLSALADCYRNTKGMDKAAFWYAKAVAQNNCPLESKLRYGQTLMTLQKYDEAKKWLEMYRAYAPNEVRVNNLIKSCEAAPSSGELNGFQAALLSFNTDGSEFGPSLRSNELVFATDTILVAKANSKNRDSWTGNSFYNLYRVDCKSGQNCGTEIKNIASKINTKYHDGPAVFSNDGTTMYFTRTHFKENFLSRGSVPDGNGTVHLQIKIATGYNAETGSFDDISNFPYNSKDYSTAHPAISPSGKTIVFVSDMPGGKGGNDLYITKLDDGGNWSQPENLLALNTEGNEMFPSLYDDNTLYFSSDGLVGWGGLDLYKSTWENSRNTFSNIQHMGPSVNSSYDDMSLVVFNKGKSGYFASNRPAAKGADNIYFADLSNLFLYIITRDIENDQPIQGADINIQSINHKSKYTADRGGQMITPIMSQTNYTITVSKPGYHPETFNLNTMGDLESDTVAYKVSLTPDFNVAYKTLVLDEVTHQPINGAMVVLKQIGGKNKSDSALVGPDGSFSYDLEPNSDYNVYAIKENYFGVEKIFSTKGINRTLSELSINDTIFMKELRVGAVYKIENIYYDYDKSNIREDAKPSLNQLLTILEQYPEMTIQLNAHTDCRGSESYNMHLSKARAQSVVNYLVERGISTNRMKSKGFGESSPVDQCSSCDNCSEEQHQNNRRTEFEILSM